MTCYIILTVGAGQTIVATLPLDNDLPRTDKQRAHIGLEPGTARFVEQCVNH